MKYRPAAQPKSRLRCLHFLESGCVGPLHGRTPAQRHSASASTRAMIAACASRSGSRLTWKANSHATPAVVTLLHVKFSEAHECCISACADRLESSSTSAQTRVVEGQGASRRELPQS